MNNLTVKKQCNNCDLFEPPIQTKATTVAAHAHSWQWWNSYSSNHRSWSADQWQSSSCSSSHCEEQEFEKVTTFSEGQAPASFQRAWVQPVTFFSVCHSSERRVKRHKPSHGTHFPHMCSCVNAPHACIALMHTPHDFLKHSSFVVLKRKLCRRPHPHALPRQSDGHSAPQCTHLRRKPRQYYTNEEHLRCSAEYVWLSG